MPAITINGTTFNDFPQAFAGNLTAPAAGNYYATPPYGKPPVEGAFQYQEQRITFPGVLNAMGTKRIAFGPRLIHAELIIVGTSKNSAQSSAGSIIDAFNQVTRYTIGLPGVSRPGCKLLTAQEVDWAFSFAERYCVVLACDFIQCQVS